MSFRLHSRRPSRPHPLRAVAALALVLAQAVNAVGFPQYQPEGGGCVGGACGCGTPAAGESCCCAGGGCKPKPVAPVCGPCGQPRGSCCCSTPAAPPAKLVWVPAFKARQCRGETPQPGAVFDLPTTAPPPAVGVFTSAAVVERLSVADSRLHSASHVPDAPPPRAA